MESPQSTCPAQDTGNDLGNPKDSGPVRHVVPEQHHEEKDSGNHRQEPRSDSGFSRYPNQDNGNNRHPRSNMGNSRGPNQYNENWGNSRNYDQRRDYNQGSNWDSRGSRGFQNEKKDDTSISRNLSNILRHNAEKFKLKMDSSGYIYVDDILMLTKFSGVTLDDIKRIVKENDKQRFSLLLEESSQKQKIRANQGHSIKFESLDLGLVPIDDPEKFPHVLHGTYYASWEAINKQGLKTMSRVHIHFAPGLPGDDGVISGMRSSCEILVFVDLKKAIEDGLKFFVSANNVILSSGDKDGIIAPKYFSKVIDRKTGKILSQEESGPVKKKLPVGMTEEDLDKNQGAKNKPKKQKTETPKKKPLPVGMSEEDIKKPDSKKKSKKESKKTKKESDAEQHSPAKTIESKMEASASEIQKEEENVTEVADEPKEKSSKKNKDENTKKLDKRFAAKNIESKMEASASEIQKEEENVTEVADEPKEKSSKKNKDENTKKQVKRFAETENANLEDHSKTKKSKEAPNVFFIDNAKDKELNQLKEQPVLGVHAFKQEENLVYVLISLPGIVFVFELVDDTKKFLKQLLEKKGCQKLMFDYTLIKDLKEQLEILLKKTTVADIKLLCVMNKKRSFETIAEMVSEVTGKINVPQDFDKYQDMALKLQDKCRNVRKQCSLVSELVPLFEEVKSSMDDGKEEFYGNYDKLMK